MGRLITHTCYHTGTGAQAMALAALDDPTYIERMRDRYREGADTATATLRGRFHAPDGGGFVFLDLRGDGRSANELLLAFLDRHIALAPGRVFGAGFEDFARLCCTNIPPDELRRACEVLNDVLGV
jgi:aspartate/methionine/tyrosine aminotransferase